MRGELTWREANRPPRRLVTPARSPRPRGSRVRRPAGMTLPPTTTRVLLTLEVVAILWAPVLLVGAVVGAGHVLAGVL